MDESVLEQQLTAYAQPHFSQHLLASICAEPMRLHVLPFAAYVHNWRWCLRYWGKQFGEKVKISCQLIWTVELKSRKNDPAMTLKLENISSLQLGFSQVQTLRDLLDSVLSLASYCSGTLRVVRCLQESDMNGCSGLRSSLDTYSTQLLDCVESVFALKSRISNLIDLVRPPWIRTGCVADRVTVRIRARCKKPIHRHRNEQGSRNSHGKNSTSRRTIDNG